MKSHPWIAGTLAGLALIIVVALAGLLYVRSGRYSVAATRDHTALTLALIDMTMESSVERHAEGIAVPEHADTLAGFAAYDEMCIACHGGPGIERSEAGKGLYPEAPELADADNMWTDAELFWIIKHGIKMSGMPAFGDTHPDGRIWSMVAFLHELSGMNHDDYIALRETSSRHAAHDEHGAAAPAD